MKSCYLQSSRSGLCYRNTLELRDNDLKCLIWRITGTINVKFNRSYYGLKKNDQALRGGISGTK